MSGKTILIWFLLLASPLAVFSQGNFFDQALSPFGGIDLVRTYETNSSLIDGIIFFLIMLGLTHISLGNRYSGNGGKAISVGVALMLTFGLLLAEREIGFNLKSFGPLAGLIVIILAGLVFFEFIRGLGFGFASASSLAFLIVYFTMLSMVPNYFTWIAEKVPFINALLIVIVIICVVVLIRGLFHKKDKIIAGVEQTVAGPSAIAKDLYNSMQELSQERGLIKQKLEGMTQTGLKTNEAMIQDLHRLVETIEKHGSSNQGRKIIGDILRKLSGEDNEFRQAIANIKQIDERLRNFDFRFNHELEGKYGKLSPDEQKLFRQELDDERTKIALENRISRWDAAAQQLNNYLAQCLQSGIAFLNRSDLSSAKRQVLNAINALEKNERLLTELKQFEKKLVSITEKEYAVFRREVNQ